MNLSIDKTNSWHWLTAAVVISLGIASYLWTQQVTPTINRADRMERQLRNRLRGLQILDEAQISSAKEKIKALDLRRKETKEAYDALKIEPIPSSAETAFALKNRIDAALAARNLRILSNEVAVGVQSSERGTSSPEKSDIPGQKTWFGKPPYITEEFNYSVIGSFQNMFMFLWRESALKSSYHLKNFTVKHTPSGLMQMDFVLQVSHK